MTVEEDRATFAGGVVGTGLGLVGTMVRNATEVKTGSVDTRDLAINFAVVMILLVGGALTGRFLASRRNPRLNG